MMSSPDTAPTRRCCRPDGILVNDGAPSHGLIEKVDRLAPRDRMPELSDQPVKALGMRVFF